MNEYVFEQESDDGIECRILKILDITPVESINAIPFQQITYIQGYREMYFKNSKIILTIFESTLVNYIITHNGYCNIKEFEIFFSTLNGQHVSNKSIVVSINRFRRKVLYQTGYDIIKSKYGFGYILNT